MKKSLDHTFIALLTVTALLPPACAVYSPNAATLNKTCLVPSDQSGTMEGKWAATPGTPIPVAFQASAFSTADIAAMTAAMDSWNKFFQASKNVTVFNYGANGTPQTTEATDPATGSLCAQAIVAGAGTTSTFNGTVGIYKVSPWPASYSSSFIALTSYCLLPAVPGQTYAPMSMAVMEINYQNFFVAGAEQPDLQSVILHEMGHLLGLDHSCGTKSGMIDCSTSGMNADYLNAVMYPVFNFDPATLTGQQKRTLGNNDQERANCLY